MFDVLVIGGGIVGIALARQLILSGVNRVGLLEQSSGPLSVASGGNSGIFHTGFDAPPFSLESQCIKKSNVKMEELLKTFAPTGPSISQKFPPQQFFLS
mmetsp:Transcript_30119/g.41602  ORF Transcript_30119/g.41602 Transcript_30119/m.41602 type:complete len:99 (+) Transcript_30119:36-332(+)